MNGVRAVWLTCGLLLAGAVVACACGLPLIWDGAYQLAASLVRQEPYFYQTRFHSWVLWWPCVVLSKVTNNLTLLTFAFGLPFIAAPAVSLWMSWLVVRRHRPELVVWAAFGVAVAGLPGQVFVINDSIWQQTMFWPVFLGALVPISRRCALALGLLAVFQFPHQAGILLLGAAVAAALAVGWVQPEVRRSQYGKAAVLGGFLLVAVAKALWVANPAWSGALHDSYATQKMSWEELRTTWRDGVFGPPLFGMIVMWLAAFAALSRSRIVWRYAVLAVLSAGALWVWWAAEPARWAGAINYRRWAIPFAFPFLAAAALAGCCRTRAITPLNLAVAPAVVFFAVITFQSLGWQQLVRRLVADVAKDDRIVVPREAVPWIAQTPIDHWGMTSLIALHEGPRPGKYFAFDGEATTALHDGRIWLGHAYTIPAEPGPAGFFDHRPLLEQWKLSGQP